MKLAVIAEFDPSFEPHPRTNAAIEHSAAALGLSVDFEWISTADNRLSDLSDHDTSVLRGHVVRSPGEIDGRKATPAYQRLLSRCAPKARDFVRVALRSGEMR